MNVGRTKASEAPGSARSTPGACFAPPLGRLAVSLRVTLVVVLLLLSSGSQAAQPLARTPVDPQLFGFEIAGGAPIQNSDPVWVRTDSGQRVVGQVYVQVGPHRIVLLPDGSLVARPTEELQPAEEPFRPLTKEQLAAQLTTQQALQGFQVRQSRHYVFLYNTSEAFALGTSRILESMLPGVLAQFESMGLKVQAPELPLAVIMFRSQEDFQRYRNLPPGVLAFYDVRSNHIVLYEPTELAQWRPDVALQQAIGTVAHEGAHQILHNIGVQQRLSVWPMWLSEGLAEFLAPTTIDKRLRWKGAGQVHDLRMLELEAYLKQQAEAPDGRIVEQTVTAARLTSTGYASAWALTHFLAKTERESFQKLVREASALGPLERYGQIEAPGVILGNRVLFERYFGSDLAKTEQGLLRHLARQPYRDPFAHLPHYVAMLTFADGNLVRREAKGFHLRSMAQQWQRDWLEQIPEPQRGQVQMNLREFPNRLVAERFLQQWLRGEM